jgi:hypothetical protein
MTYSPSFQEGKKTSLINTSPALAKGSGAVTKFFVRTTGSDLTGDGLTVGTAFATLGFAMQQIPLISSNTPFFIDVTGINETLDSVIFSPDIPNPIASYTYLSTYADAIDGYFIGPLCVHADLQVAQTIAAADVLSISTNVTTGLETIITSGGLTINALVGKIVRQAGSVFGVVASNTATDIVTTSLAALSAGVDVEICDPGAQLNNFLTLNQESNLWFEGLILQQEISGVAVSESSAAGTTFVACQVGTFEIINGESTIFSRCYIEPSTALTDECRIDGAVQISGCVMETLTFVVGGVSGRFGCDCSSTIFKACGPLGAPQGGGALGPGQGIVTIRNCSFINPTSSAVNATGFGSYQVKDTTIDGAAAAALRFDGLFKVSLEAIPAGTGNLGIGCQLVNGVNLSAVAATVAITGGAGDVKVGNLAIQTWASVTGAANNRSSDYSATGDGSTARRV